LIETTIDTGQQATCFRMGFDSCQGQGLCRQVLEPTQLLYFYAVRHFLFLNCLGMEPKYRLCYSAVHTFTRYSFQRTCWMLCSGFEPVRKQWPSGEVYTDSGKEFNML